MPFEPRFGQAAEAYFAYRPEYPPQIFERILAALPPDRRQRAVDLGAGTGRSTRELLPHFAEVIAVEPDARMAEKLRESEPRAVVRITTAEDCEQEPSSVDLVNIATALHWMDVPRVIANASRWLRPGGILAVFGGEPPDTPEPVQAIVQSEFRDHWDQFRDARLRRKEFPGNIVRASTELTLIEDAIIPHILPATPHDFAGFWRSTSYGSAYGRSLGDSEPCYWSGLESRFRQAWREDKIPVQFGLYLFLLRKD